ncbi:hypothetical protein MMC14_001566 [Varicellaria rhodocarpa]|nr:hypothetical protein [Varicellaria rhodocarpa]
MDKEEKTFDSRNIPEDVTPNDPLGMRAHMTSRCKPSTTLSDTLEWVRTQSKIHEESQRRVPYPPPFDTLSPSWLEKFPPLGELFPPPLNSQSMDWLDNVPPALNGETWEEFATRTGEWDNESNNDLHPFMNAVAAENDDLSSPLQDSKPTEERDVHPKGYDTDAMLKQFSGDQIPQCAGFDSESIESLRLMFYELKLTCFEMANSLSQEFYPQEFTAPMIRRQLKHIEFEIKEVRHVTTLWKDWQRSWKKNLNELLWEIDLGDGPNAGRCIHDNAEITTLLQRRCGIREVRLNADSVAYAVWHLMKKGFLWTAEQRQALKYVFDNLMKGYRWKTDEDLASIINETFEISLSEERVKLELDYLITKNFILPKDKDECQKRYKFKALTSSEIQVHNGTSQGVRISAKRLCGGRALQSESEPTSDSPGQNGTSWEDEFLNSELGLPLTWEDMQPRTDEDEEATRIVEDFDLKLHNSSDVDMDTDMDTPKAATFEREGTSEMEESDYTSVCTDDGMSYC